jgi:integrase
MYSANCFLRKRLFRYERRTRSERCCDEPCHITHNAKKSRHAEAITVPDHVGTMIPNPHRDAVVRHDRLLRKRPGSAHNRRGRNYCGAQGLPNATWLTFRRTYSSWAHEQGIPSKVVAELMEHAKVDTTLNVYTQVIDGAKLAAAGQIKNGLITIDHKPKNGIAVTR